MNNELISAVNQICAERGVDPSIVFTALQTAIADAYQKENGVDTKVKIEIDRLSGLFHMYVVKEVVKAVVDEKNELSLADAKKFSKEVKVGDELEIEVPVGSLGRIAAQVAKYTVLSKIRDAEREAVVEFYSSRLGEIITGKVQGVRANLVLVEMEKGVGEMPEEEQIKMEFYEIGRRYRFLVKELINEENNRHVVLSRSDEGFIKALFAMEVPEIANEQVEIKGIARFSGVRSKVAVASNQDGLDPQGACIGQRGMRINAIMTEVGDEKIDIVKWDLDIVEYIKNALSPANVTKVLYNHTRSAAIVVVPEDQLSLAIGREGTNVRLASLLTGVELSVVQEGEEPKERTERQKQESKKARKQESKKAEKPESKKVPKEVSTEEKKPKSTKALTKVVVKKPAVKKVVVKK
ncbi:transcription termination/antitermination protein NusA [Candidatus Dojkabacteria bacterium CG_4_9_14_3_um_filter_150_Dojkabacteria_WS6_41_13]|uniref:Transcription termination/antitermination protein NusA n=1 Tax=Candidatus Dojkabacteria bacterium CG_4_10_14_0_2_um_filter_Dojkabacteria_WS6_41_15 TaxID=2014249 RepID=A0A2M7W351_9BACT|nr:MAG: transcription termination/antitermination protein NusA [Candidatus Dojkabacteria bacterium CG_4_10_14_0_2_um_filter_Dojkabacteria_WS6_41_15]PJB23537.1 MAG: transcription termination/antitermination protein NusA [Candidatus Dojkabacteria bacterium CG_4_9_14_3_um_filter_150_Dojkabacteria_WS6_41_13]